MARQVKVAFVGDSSSLRRAFKDSEQAGRKYERSLGVLKTAAKTGALAVGAGLAAGLAFSAKAAIDAEKSQARLNAQLRALGKDTPKARKEIDRTVQSLSKMSGFDDEDLQDAFTNLVRGSKDVSGSLENMGLVADLARARQISLASASDAVNKVNAGSFRILKTLGIETDNIKTKEQALAALRTAVAGQAEAYGKTTAGAFDRVNVAAENLAEQFGRRFGPVLASVLNWLANVGIPKFEAAIHTAVAWIKGNVVPVIQNVVSTAQALWARFGGFITDALRRVVAVLGPLFQTIKAVFDTFGALLRGDWAAVWEGIKAIVTNALRAVIAILRGLVGQLFATAKALGVGIVGGVKAGLVGLAGLAGDLISKIGSAVAAAAGAVYQLGKSIARKLLDGIVQGLKDAAGSAAGAVRDFVERLNPFDLIKAKITPQASVALAKLTPGTGDDATALANLEGYLQRGLDAALRNKKTDPNRIVDLANQLRAVKDEIAQLNQEIADQNAAANTPTAFDQGPVGFDSPGGATTANQTVVFNFPDGFRPDSSHALMAAASWYLRGAQVGALAT